LMATPDEESGGERGTSWMSTNHWGDISPRYVLDQGGYATPDLLSAEGKLTFAVSVAEKKALWIKIHATGSLGLGSEPRPSRAESNGSSARPQDEPFSDNANDRLLLALSRLRAVIDSPAEDRQSAVVAELRRRVGKLADNQFTRAIQKNTMSITSLRSGLGDPPLANFIPPSAEATVDFELLPDSDFAGVMRSIQRAVGSVPGAQLEVLRKRDRTPVSSTDTPLYKALESAVLAQNPTAVVTPYLIPFGTDSNILRIYGANCYGFNPMRLDAQLVGTIHSDGERIPLGQFAPALRCYYEVVKGYVTQR
jgi:acetylornithine deacetylase/succinyl-diaminopimelate desuccinylase-like protein